MNRWKNCWLQGAKGNRRRRWRSLTSRMCGTTPRRHRYIRNAPPAAEQHGISFSSCAKHKCTDSMAQRATLGSQFRNAQSRRLTFPRSSFSFQLNCQYIQSLNSSSYLFSCQTFSLRNKTPLFPLSQTFLLHFELRHKSSIHSLHSIRDLKINRAVIKSGDHSAID